MAGLWEDLFGNQGMDQDCVVQCQTPNECLLNGCQKKGNVVSYTCVECKKTFESGWSEEEARAHHAATAPGYKFEDCEKVCIECYEKLFKDICQ